MRLLVVLICFSTPLLGLSQGNTIELTLPNENTSSSVKDYVYESQQWLSDQLVSFSNQVDSLFGEKTSMLEQNGTRVRLFNIWRNEAGLEGTQETLFQLDFRLPNLQKKLRFDLEKKADTEQDGIVDTDKRVAQKDAIKNDEDVRAGLSYLLDDVKKFNLKLSTGLRLSQSVVPYARFRINRDFKVGEGNIRFLTQSYWDQTDQFNQNLRLNYTVRFRDDLFFSFINDATWFENTRETLASQGPTLHHRLSDRRDMFYSLRANSSSLPQYQLDNYYFGISYRQRIMSHWFFYELTPYLTFPRENNFKKNEGVLFTLQAMIGSL